MLGCRDDDGDDEDDDDDDVDDNPYSILGCREKRALRANSSSSWSTTGSILNMVNKDEHDDNMLTTRSILNMMNKDDLIIKMIISILHQDTDNVQYIQ